MTFWMWFFETKIPLESEWFNLNGSSSCSSFTDRGTEAAPLKRIENSDITQREVPSDSIAKLFPFSKPKLFNAVARYFALFSTCM